MAKPHRPQRAKQGPAKEHELQRHLTQDEVADRLQISPRTLESWRVSGLGPAFLKVGTRVRYRLEDLKAYEAAQRRRMVLKPIGEWE
jgi:hypothetical protein